jgi:glutathione S-transferase
MIFFNTTLIYASVLSSPFDWEYATQYISGPALSLADILAFCYIEWGDNDRIGYPFDHAAHPTLGAWLERMRQRPSASV